MFCIDEYDYDLPEELIAQEPALNRDGARLLVIERHRDAFLDHRFSDLPGILRPGDLLVVNNTKVVPARLSGRKESGGRVEILVLEHPDPAGPGSDTRWCLVKASRRPEKGTRLFLESGMLGLVENRGENGLMQISFQGPTSIDLLIEEKGRMPLPPYIIRDRQDSRSSMDRERYQTIFSKRRGAIAAPTAGLHFTDVLIEALHRAGVSLVEITLHVGYGTFRPVRTKDIRDHSLGEESYVIDPDAVHAINRAKENGARTIAVGTTVARALETAAGVNGRMVPCSGKTGLLITPGFQFKVVDGMITNFHLPRSSLLFLVSALAGLDLIKKAYRWAVEKRYRFYSYGDAMLII